MKVSMLVLSCSVLFCRSILHLQRFLRIISSSKVLAKLADIYPIIDKIGFFLKRFILFKGRLIGRERGRRRERGGRQREGEAESE